MTYFYRAIAFLLLLLAAPSARACSCPSPIVKDGAGNLRQADVVADFVVEKLRPGSDRSYKIATVRVTRGWKGANTGARLDVEFGGDSTCATSIPEIGATEQKAPLNLLKRARAALYSWPICFDGVSASVVEKFAAEREALDAKARAAPDDADAQLALLAHFLYWKEPALALPLAKEVARRWPDNPLAQLRLAEALTAAGKPKQANAAKHQAWESRTLRARIELLEIKMGQASKKTPESGRTGYLSSDGRNDFSRSDLSNSILSQVLFRSNFNGHGSDFTGARFANVGFEGGDFVGARLNKAFFYSVEFNAADLSGVEAREFTCYSCAFAGADLRGFEAPQASLFDARLTRADLSRANLEDADLRHADLRAARLVGTKLDRANLSDANLREATFDGTSLRGANLHSADLRGADLSRADLSSADLKNASVDCATRLPERFDASTFALIPKQACPNEKPLVLRAGTLGRQVSDANFADARIDFAWVKHPPAFHETVLDRATLVNLEEGSRLRLSGVSARGAKFEDFAGELSIFNSDASNVSIFGKAGARERNVYLSRTGGRLDGATVRNVRLEVSDSSRKEGDDTETSIEKLRLENVSIQCRHEEPRSNVIVISDPPAKRERDRRRMVSNFILDLEFARKLASLDGSNKLEDDCANAIKLYLSDSCKAGMAKAGFAYQCPPAP
ncbi:MAG: pentapeptide repeat-containing protein [Methylocystis sp.]|uniref:pentapeptide repeat-containing protein n=1 Tax=Methylocystis sp. TaxID=1911079 RepID=UPI003D0C63DD